MWCRAAAVAVSWAVFLGGCSRGCLDDEGSAPGDPKAAPPSTGRPPKWAVTLAHISQAARQVDGRSCNVVRQGIEKQKALDAWGRPLWVRCTGGLVEICSSGDDGAPDPRDAGVSGDDQCLDVERAAGAAR
jgi:hypothetical protein